MRRPEPRTVAAALLALLPLLLLFRPLFRAEAFLPAGQLAHVQPWRTADPPPWNVLQFDGIVQFYPWRLETVRQWRAGKVPLSNPYAFATDGGAPLLANSQSAPFYPPNWIFTLLGPDRVWAGFGIVAALHLLILGFGMARFARALGLDTAPATLAAAATTLSAPVVAWLTLPTLLSVAAWFPWLLLAIRRRRPVAAGAIAGLALLGGHLQVAFYVLGFGAAFALWEAVSERASVRKSVPGVVVAGAIAFALAAPQLLPTLEMGRISHRGGVAATAPGYAAYNANAVPPRHAATLLMPDVYGNPARNHGVTWLFNRDGVPNNYAEWAFYFGVAPYLLALAALTLPWRRADTGVLRERRFLAAMTGAALLMAFGTPVNALLYYGVPGFAATGNPGRVLVFAVMALSLLAGIGLQEMRKKPLGAALAVAVLIHALALRSAGDFARERGLAVADLVTIATPGALLALAWLAAAVVLLFVRLHPKRGSSAAGALVLLTVADLLAWGHDYNPTAPPADVFRETPGIAWLRRNAADAPIACLNAGWSIAPAGPGAGRVPPVLPPNALTVWRLRDIGGYDSLVLRETKDRIRAATGDDPSPPENGNMVFVKSVAAARALGARFVVLPTTDAVPDDPELRLAYQGDDLTVYETPEPSRTVPPRPWATTAVRVGLYGFALAAGLFGGLLGYRKRK